VTAPVLETRKLNKSFGALQVAREIDFALHAGDRHALIGPNGAGKTTFVNLLTGRLPPSAGQILLHGRDITHMAQYGRVKAGIARTFQINQLFRGLTVLENVYMAVAEHLGAARGMVRPAGLRADVLTETERLIDLVKLGAFAGRRISELPYGQQRLVEIAIALALEPKVLLLDEPAAGVPSSEQHIILDAVDALSKDIAVLIIEHDMDVVFRFARKITVLVQGAVLASDAPEAIAANATVREVYLGGGHFGGQHG
jgi:ABC-type branched-subunit amino acid transport system ATPase component